MNSEHILNKDWHSSKLVYHYTKRDIALEKILADRTLRLGPFASVNDPWESKDWNLVIRSAPDDQTGELMHEVVDWLNRAAKRHAKVVCTTRDREPEIFGPNGAPPSSPKGSCFHRGYARARMWAQYADCHKGVCLAFLRDRLSAMIEQSAGTAKIFSNAVEYDDYLSLSDATEVDYDDVERVGKQEAIRCHIHDFHRALFFLKSRDWQDEAEFRWVVLCDNEEPLFVPFGDALAAVILGADFHPSYLPALTHLADGLSSVFRMVWVNGMPGIAKIA